MMLLPMAGVPASARFSPFLTDLGHLNNGDFVILTALKSVKEFMGSFPSGKQAQFCPLYKGKVISGRKQ